MKKPKQTKLQKDMDKFCEEGDKAFEKWNKRNNLYMPWENSLGPKSKSIRASIFLSGWLARDLLNTKQ